MIMIPFKQFLSDLFVRGSEFCIVREVSYRVRPELSDINLIIVAGPEGKGNIIIVSFMCIARHG